MEFAELCNSSGPLTIFLIIKILFSIICTIVPLIIMYRFFVAMFKTVMSGDAITKELTNVVTATILGLCIFLLPTAFHFIFVDLMEADDVAVVSCFDKASLDNVKKLREDEKVRLKEELDSDNADKADVLNKQKEEEQRKREEIKKANEEYRKKKEEEEAAKRQEQQNNNNNGGGSGSTNTPLKKAGKNIIIGDSRTVGMCSTVTGGSSGCSYSSGGPKISGDDIFISQGSMSYSWFNSTAVGAVNSILSSNSDTTYNIYSLMGVNMLLYDIDKYVSTYNNLATGAWKNHNVILVSVTPVDESKEAQYGYSTKNSDIMTFNSKLKSGVVQSNVKYCDAYSSMVNNLSTTDGLHYTGATYNSLYSKIKACGS